MSDRKDPTGAQVRGQIQSGDTGDIRPGFDPAAAPMETDAEAAGAPITTDQARTALDDRANVKPDRQSNFDVAMRQPGSAKTTSQTGRIFPTGLLIAILVAAAVGMAVLSWLHG
ncbi:hypothetical protein FE844_027510 (plasmid) [Rhizobium indicum]|uniref:hypothetical protein n=1 Tax=Rhizobium indicum TaxID=2583231 RepID=UPI0011066AC9|nr:hypothetical protein [Rhizobium indicum]QKK33313.1 hypothetical protein FE844_027510 [Rhizobium indicum]